MGDWDAPVFGELGVLAQTEDGTRVQCHACGAWFAAISSGHLFKHNLTAEEYKCLFGLSNTTALISTALYERKRAHASAQYAEGRAFTPETIRRGTPEQLVGGIQRRPRSLQARRNMSAAVRATLAAEPEEERQRRLARRAEAQRAAGKARARDWGSRACARAECENRFALTAQTMNRRYCGHPCAAIDAWRRRHE